MSPNIILLHTMKFEIHAGDFLHEACDLLVVAVVAEKKKEADVLFVPRGDAKKLDDALAGLLTDTVADEGFHGQKGETLVLQTQRLLRAKRVVLIGLGALDALSLERLREAAGTAILHAQRVNAKTLEFVLDAEISFAAKEYGQAVTEGALLAAYHFSKYQSKKEKERTVRAVECFIMGANGHFKAAELKQGIVIGQQTACATIFARDLVNEPAFVMKPRMLVEEARALAKKYGFACQVINEVAAEKMGMGSFCAVARGSEEEGFIIHLTYRPDKKIKNSKKIVLCGKGITFDSGGLSLKPAHYMMDMKSDMAGAAVLLGIFSIIDQLAPSWEVHAVIATTENMPSGKAAKPGDVVQAYNGKTIEILNTDAEGRLVLADALSWANATIKPDAMIDIATLTGAAIIALGQQVAAVFGNNDVWLARYKKAAESAGEYAWELPIVDEYRKLLDSQIADIQNIARVSGADVIMGALFLLEFVGKTPWVHVDIAGPAWVDKPEKSYTPYGASGYGVRTLIELLRQLK